MNSHNKQYDNQFDPLLGVPGNQSSTEPIKTGPLPASPVSRLFNASGLYSWKSVSPTNLPDTAVLTPPHNLAFTWGIGYEALRLDVDGHHPQMMASGTIKNLFHTVHWLANLEPVTLNTWAGEISDINGVKSAFPYTAVQITAIRSIFRNQRQLNVTFLGEGAPDRHNILKFETPYFQKINLTFDFATTLTPLSAVAASHSPLRQISMAELFQEAGFDVNIKARQVLLDESATLNNRWHDQELHDAMQFFWANHDEVADPALWVFFAPLHQSGKHIGATVYDDIGLQPAQPGQGTAVFTHSFIAQPPSNITEPADWLRFGLTCRQIGTALHQPPGQPHHLDDLAMPQQPSDYLDDCFSPDALRAMRHATTHYASRGSADWYDEQGFASASEPSLRLELRVNRDWSAFEFMEPVILELKLTNNSPHPQWVDQTSLTHCDNLTLIIKRNGRPARQFLPFKRDYQLPQPQQLQPGQSLYESLFIAAGLNGWDIAEPGSYMIQAALELAGKVTVSNQLRLRVLTPTIFTEEYLAQDFFTADVGRILAFNGSRFFHSGNQVLREIVAALPHQCVSYHAAYALGQPLTYAYKRLARAPTDSEAYLQVLTQPSRPDEARQLLQMALSRQAQTAVTTFGHIRWQQYMEQFSIWLTQQGDMHLATQTMDRLYQTMAECTVNGRKIPPSVLTDLRAKRYLYHSV